MWVPWQPGSTGREQARIKARRAARKGGGSGGQMGHSAAVAKARKAHRKAALKQLKAGKITPAQYHKQLRAIG